MSHRLARRHARLRLSLSISTILALTVPAGQALAQEAVYPVVVNNGDDPLFANLAIPANAAQAGMWSGVKDWPIVAIHSAMLPDGRILTFGAPKGGTVQDGRTLVFWDPRKGFDPSAFTIAPDAQNVDSFCASATLLSDGKLLTSGGASTASGYSSRESMVLDWRSSAAVRDYDLTAQRWYATMTKLPDGRAIITGGGAPYASADPNRPEAANDISSTPEVYTPGQGWRSLTGAYSTDAFGAKNARWWYPRQWVSPAGTLFGISTEKMWEMKLDGNGTIRTVGNFKTAADANTRPNVGPTSTAVMYDSGKILQVGGNGYYNNYGSASSAAATVIDITGIGTGQVKTTETAPMANPRQWANSTILPDGKVLVTGGSRYGDRDGADAVVAAETWNPATGRWTGGAASAVYRGYHSTATLLTDGAVLIAGGGIPGPVSNLNAEVYYPAYLFQKAGNGSVRVPRPRIVSLSTVTSNYGQTIDVQTATGDTIAEVSLIATASVTHSFDSNQRRMKLAFTRTANGIQATLPASANLAPPGYYQLALVNAAGIPSVGVIVAIAAAPPVVAATPANGAPVQQATRALTENSSIKFQPAAYPGYLLRHKDYLGYIAQINAASSALDRGDASFVVRKGRGDGTCYSFEAANLPGYYLTHENFRLKLKAGDNGAASLKPSTFCARGPLNGSGDVDDVSLESLDWPGYYLRHRNFEMWLVKHDGTAAAAGDATFHTGAAGAVPGSKIALQPATYPAYRVRHYDFAGVIAQIGANSPQVDRQDASFTVQPGLADKQCVSFVSVNYPGYYLRHRQFQLSLLRDDGSAGAAKDATFCARPALNGATDMGVVSFESLSWPGYFIRHKDYRLYIMQNDGSAAAKTDSSFVVRAPLG